MTQNKVVNIQYKLYLFLISIAFLGDILRRSAFFFELNFRRYTTVSKFIFIIVSFVFLLFVIQKELLYKKKRKKILVAIIGLSLIFIIGHIRTDIGFNLNIDLLLNNFEFLAKYLFLPYLMILFINLRSEFTLIKKLILFFEIIFYINLAAILIGFIFNISVFSTYYEGARFGYKGIYSMSGQTSLYFILLMFYYIHSLLFNKYSFYVLSKLILIVFCAFLIGTKRIYLFVPILFLYYIFFLGGYRRKITYQIGIPLSFVALFFVLILKDYFQSTLELFYDIYKDQGFVSSFTSFRSDLFLEIYSSTIKSGWTMKNMLFGGLDFSLLYTQMGFIDLFLFFGLIGFGIYMYFYKILFEFEFLHHFYWFFVGSLFVIVFLADAFILEANTPILLLLLCFYFYSHEQTRTGDI